MNSISRITSFAWKQFTVFSVCLLPVLFLLVSCGEDEPACPIPEGTKAYLSLPSELITSPTPDPVIALKSVEIDGKVILVDKVVSGPLCNDTWHGTVFVSCDVQVLPWDEDPTFLKDCDLKIEPDTVVYVAYHNNTAYYKGCSCHTDEFYLP